MRDNSVRACGNLSALNPLLFEGIALHSGPTLFTLALGKDGQLFSGQKRVGF